MTAQMRLTGTDLIDCAKASAPLGVETAARNCGYGEHRDRFLETLKNACEEIGVEIEQLQDLMTEQQRDRRHDGVSIAPESQEQL